MTIWTRNGLRMDIHWRYARFMDWGMTIWTSSGDCYGPGRRSRTDGWIMIPCQRVDDRHLTVACVYCCGRRCLSARNDTQTSCVPTELDIFINEMTSKYGGYISRPVIQLSLVPYRSRVVLQVYNWRRRQHPPRRN